MNSLQFEADILSGLDDLREQFPTAPDLAFDDPLFAFDKKAKDHNRFPARVLNDAFIKDVSTGDVEIVDEFTGQPATMQKAAPVASEEDEEPVALSPALLAEIEKISGFNAKAGWRLVAPSLSRAVAKQAKTFKVAPSFGACTCAEEGRKCLTCREKNVSRVVENGSGRTIYWEGGETYESVG